MKHKTLEVAANCLAVLAVLNVIAGIVVSVMVGIGASVPIAKIGFVVGGFIITAIFGIMLLALSRLLLLFISMDEHLAQIAASSTKKETGD